MTTKIGLWQRGMLAAVLLGTMCVGLPAAVAAPASTSASVSVTPDIDYGQKANIVGRVVRAGTTRGVPGVNVAVDQIRYGLSSWYRVALLATDANGYVRLTQPPVYNTNYRIRFGGTTAYAAVTSPARLVRVHRVVSASPSAAEIYPQDGFSVAGTVRPASAGQTVFLDRFDGTSTNQVATAAQDSSGQYTINYIPNRGGAATYRVRVPAAGGRAESYSPRFNVLVYATHFLVDEDQVAGTAAEGGPVRISGVEYPKSVWGRYGRCHLNERTYEYDLGRAAKRFRTVVGLTDLSDSDGAVRFTIVADGLAVFESLEMTLGQAAPVDLDMTGVLRLKLMTQVTRAASQSGCAVAYAAFGDARFYAAQ